MRNQLPDGGSLVTLREARQKFMRRRERALIIVQDFGEKTRLIKETVFVLRILFLRSLVLLERLLWLTEKTVAITQVGPDIWIIGPTTDGLFVMLEGER